MESSDVMTVETENEVYCSEIDTLINTLNSQSQRNTPIKSDDKIINQLQRQISEKDGLISTLNTRINELNQEVAKLKSNVPSSTGGYSQSDIEAKDKTIRSLNTEISRLRTQIKEKDRLINALNEQIGVN